MNNVIRVNNLSKTFWVYKKKSGLGNTIKNLFKREYYEIDALKSISFGINRGEIVGLVGPNGAGKTTTLKCLSGLISPTSGEVNVLGYEPNLRDEDFLAQISLIMGSKNQLWWDLPAYDTFEFTKEVYGIRDEDFDKRVNELVELLDLELVKYKPIRELSLGERMKFELINSLLHRPKVIFLDEPTIGLDVIMQDRVREFLRGYNKKYKATIILTSHYMKDVEDLCDRVILINKGELIYDDSVKKLKGERSTLEEVVKEVFNNT